MNQAMNQTMEPIKSLRPKKAVLILSGGLDSTTLLYDLVNKGYEVFPISFDYGQKHKRELKCAKQTCKLLGLKHTVCNLDVLNQLAPSALTRNRWEIPKGHYTSPNMKQTIVPNRNMVMLSLATSYAISKGAQYLFYGAHSGDHVIYPDCKPEFVDAMTRAIKLCDWWEVRLIAPYSRLTKGDIVKMGLGLKVNYNLTQTCYEGKEKACGKCGSCVERLEAFAQNKVKDPIPYKTK